MPIDELIDGIEVSMGGKKWTIPPLTMKQIKKFSGILQDLGNLDTAGVLEMADAAIDVIHAAMTRNYPEMTRDELEDLIDLGNLIPAVRAVMGVSGLSLGEAGMGSG